MTPRGWIMLALVVVMGAFAVEGGEYSTGDYLALKHELASERQAEAQLRQAVDSLSRVRKAVETSPEVQERIAREQFGMIRPGELLYRLAPAEP